MMDVDLLLSLAAVSRACLSCLSGKVEADVIVCGRDGEISQGVLQFQGGENR